MVSFVVLVFIIAVSCSAITIKTLVGYNESSLFFKLFVSFIVLLGWFAPIWVNALRNINSLPTQVYGFIEQSGYFLFGAMFLLFCVLLLRDICWFSAYGLSKWFHFYVIDPKDIQMLLKANLVSVFLAGTLSFYALYEGLKIPKIKEIEISSPKITKETTVLLVTDLHIGRGTSTASIRKTIDAMNARNSDVIVLVGDIIDDTPAYMKPQLQELSRLRAKHGVYAALGNHEFYRGQTATTAALFEAGFKVLIGNGEKVKGTDIFMMGITDYGTALRLGQKVSIENILKHTQPEDYKILLSHTPHFIDTLKNNEIDIQFSGHTHGGQIFPFHIGVIMANHYLAGLYDVGEMKLFVSRGAGTWGPPMRLLAPSDVAVIRLKPQL